jgi:hypothetical protein
MPLHLSVAVHECGKKLGPVGYAGGQIRVRDELPSRSDAREQVVAEPDLKAAFDRQGAVINPAAAIPARMSSDDYGIRNFGLTDALGDAMTIAL